ncbi:hypothetical protein Tco_1413779 [Tanacetum coccineum]
MCDNEIQTDQHAVEYDDERAALANLIANLKLDVDENKNIQKQLKKANASLAHELKECRSILAETSKTLGESNSPTFNGRPTVANPIYLKKAQYEKPCMYEIPYDQSDPTNRLVPDREETLTFEKESRSKLNKDLVRPYDYIKLNSLYEIFKPASQEYNEQLAHANEVRKKM